MIRFGFVPGLALEFLSALLIGELVKAAPTPSTPEQRLEKRVQFAFKSARTLIKACSVSDECGLSTDEMTLAKSISANDANYSERTLEFIGEAAGGFSSIDGDPHRMMLTGLTPSSPILIHPVRIASVTMEALIGLFAHELVHHLGYQDDTTRMPDRFGARIAAISRSYTMPLSLGLSQTDAFVLNYPQPIQAPFANLFPKGLFPSIYIEQPAQNIVQEFWMLEREGEMICKQSSGPPAVPGEVIWSSSALVIGNSKDPTHSNVSFRLLSRCFDAIGLSIREVITYADTRIEYRSADADFISTATLSFSLTPTDPQATAYLDVDVTSAPLTAKAGDLVEFKAVVEAPSPVAVSGCGALYSNPAWTESASEYPLTITIADCEILSRNGDRKFEIAFRFRVPAGITDGLDISIAAIGLKLRDGGFYRGIPRRATKVKLTNGSPGPRIATVERSIVGATHINPTKYPNAYYIRQGDRFQFKIRLPGVTADSIAEGFVAFQGQTIDRQMMTGNMTLDKYDFTCSRAPELECLATIDIARFNPTNEIIMWAPTMLVFLTSDLQFKAIDISADGIAVVATVPGGTP